VDQLTNLYSETMWFNFIGPLNMMARNRMLNHITQRWAPDVPPGDLVRGLIGLKSIESNRELIKLAAQARTLDLQQQSLLAEADEETIRPELSQTEPGRELLTAFDAFLEQHGFLSASGTDLSRTPWSEQPTLIWHTIGRVIGADVKSEAEDALVIRESAQARVRAELNWPMQVIFDRVLASTITYIHLREQSSFLISQDSFEMRRIFLALADHLVAQGDLEHREDIFYLELDEVQQLVTGDLGDEVAQDLVSTRRAEMEYDAQIELPNTICGDQFQACVVQLSEDQEYLVGISGSSGVTQGYAQVVLDPSEAPTVLTQEDILVVPFTDMSWTPLFSVVGGVVAETGGQLSHSAIVAREYGLPAVVNVKNATRFIKNGQPILVDGTNGRVYLNHNDE
jgi:pyruvate,water dikinase